MTKAQDKRDALELWWDRGPWPCVILAIDPGRVSGWAIIVSDPGGYRLVEADSCNLYSPQRAMESAVTCACTTASGLDLPLVAVLEDWGAGGTRGLKQWVGLGEARGPWRRELNIAAVQGHLTKSRILLINMPRWRSRIIPETGIRIGDKWRKFEAPEWKEAAKRAASDLFIATYVPPLDAAEAACIGAYAMRSDEVLSRLPKRLLDQYNIPEAHRVMLEDIIAMKKPKRRPAG